MPATVEVLYRRALISDQLHDQIVEAKCNFTNVAFKKDPTPKECVGYLKLVFEALNVWDEYNIYQHAESADGGTELWR